MTQVDDYLLDRSSPFSLGSSEENRTNLTLVQSAAATSNINGTVTNAVTGDHLANVIVKLSTSSGDPVAHTETNPGGNYSLQGIAPGTYTINIALRGFVTPTGQAFTIQGGQTLKIDFAMTPETRPLNDIYGFVTNQSTGLPLADIDVALLNATDLSKVMQVATNTSGQYLMCSVVDGSYVISAKGPGFYDASLIPIIISGGSLVRSDITLTAVNLPQSTVNGFIKNSSGNQIPNACVGLYLLDLQGIENLQQVTFSDASGFYIFGRAVAGNYVVKSKSEKTSTGSTKS